MITITYRAIGVAVTRALNEGRIKEAEVMMEALMADRTAGALRFNSDTIERLRQKIKNERDKAYLSYFLKIRGGQ